MHSRGSIFFLRVGVGAWDSLGILWEKRWAHPSQSLFDWCFKRVAARVHIGVVYHARLD